MNENPQNPRPLRRALMAKRDAALAAGDVATYHSLTREIAALPNARRRAADT